MKYEALNFDDERIIVNTALELKHSYPKDYIKRSIEKLSQDKDLIPKNVNRRSWFQAMGARVRRRLQNIQEISNYGDIA